MELVPTSLGVSKRPFVGLCCLCQAIVGNEPPISDGAFGDVGGTSSLYIGTASVVVKMQPF